MLLQNERIDDCIRELEAHNDNTDAFGILAHQLRLREAMQLPLKDAVEPAKQLDSLGLRKAAITLLSKYPPVPETVTQDMRYAAELRRLGQEPQAREYEDRAWRLQGQGNERLGAFQALLPDYELFQEAQFWAGGGAEDVGREKFEAACQIVLHPKKQVLADDFIDQILSKMHDGWYQYPLHTAVSALVRTGNIVTARQLILTWCQRTRNPTLLSLLGDTALENGQNAEAADDYLKAATVNRTDASLMYRTGIALARQGKKEEGRQMMDFAPFLALGDRDQIRQMYRAIRQFEGEPAALAWISDYGSRFGDPSEYLGERIAFARDAALKKGDLATALQWQTRALFCATGKDDDLLYHRLRALDALQRKDNVTLADALQHGLNLGPPDVELLEKTLPSLRSADKAAADRILAQAIARLVPVAEDYPEATKYVEELARLRMLTK